MLRGGMCMKIRTITCFQEIREYGEDMVDILCPHLLTEVQLDVTICCTCMETEADKRQKVAEPKIALDLTL